ncbi:ribonuclease III [Marasmius fiardii PR-910]|nr:ribonuclease III [Marasmius fiardii PR-910]
MPIPWPLHQKFRRRKGLCALVLGTAGGAFGMVAAIAEQSHAMTVGFGVAASICSIAAAFIGYWERLQSRLRDSDTERGRTSQGSLEFDPPRAIVSEPSTSAHGNDGPVSMTAISSGVESRGGLRNRHLPTRHIPLPKIRSKDIERKVFTHRSYYNQPNHVFEDQPDDASRDNETFEHLGDSVLSMVVTELLLEMYPELRIGPSTKIRALIVNNTTLADISMRYQLPNWLRLHPATEVALRACVHIQADVFEAFVGGLYSDQGMESVRPWLKSLLRPYAITAYDSVRVQHGLPPHTQSRAQTGPLSGPELCSGSWSTSSPLTPGTESELDSRHSGYVHPEVQTGYLALFNQIVAKKNLEWTFIARKELATQNTERNGRGPSSQGPLPDPHDKFQSARMNPIWIARAMVDGKCYGEGRGRTKAAAKHEAAKKGLEELGAPV